MTAPASSRSTEDGSSTGTRQRIGIACAYCRYRKIRCCGGEPCKHCRTGRRACLYVSVAEWQSFHKGVRVDHPPNDQERSSHSASPPTVNRSKLFSAPPVLGKRTRSEASSHDLTKGQKKPEIKISRSRTRSSAPNVSAQTFRSLVSVAEPSSTSSSSSTESGAYSGYYSPAAGFGICAPDSGIGADYDSSASSAALSRDSTPDASNLTYHVPAASAQAGSVYLPAPAVQFNSLWPAASARRPAGPAGYGHVASGSVRPEHLRPYEHSVPPSPFLSTHPVHQHSYYNAAEDTSPDAERPLNIAGWVPSNSGAAASELENQPSTTPPTSSTMPSSLGEAAGYYLGFTAQDLDRILRSYASLLPVPPPTPAQPHVTSQMTTIGRKPSVSYNSAAEADLSALRDFELGAFHSSSLADVGPLDEEAAGVDGSVNDRTVGPVQMPAIEDFVVGFDASLPLSPMPDEDAGATWIGHGSHF